jgi:hypothetical protein
MVGHQFHLEARNAGLSRLNERAKRLLFADKTTFRFSAFGGKATNNIYLNVIAQLANAGPWARSGVNSGLYKTLQKFTCPLASIQADRESGR